MYIVVCIIIFFILILFMKKAYDVSQEKDRERIRQIELMHKYQFISEEKQRLQELKEKRLNSEKQNTEHKSENKAENKAENKLTYSDKFYDFIRCLPKYSVPVEKGIPFEKLYLDNMPYVQSSNIDSIVTDFVAIDTETTGLGPLEEIEILEICAVRFKNSSPVECFHTYLNVEAKIQPKAYDTHKIDKNMVADKPYFGEIVASLMRFIGDSDLVGHNIIKYDLPVLYRNGYDFSHKKRKIYDTYLLSRKLIKKSADVANYQLTTLTNFVTGLMPQSMHSALTDALATGFLFLKLVDTVRISILKELCHLPEVLSNGKKLYTSREYTLINVDNEIFNSSEIDIGTELFIKADNENVVAANLLGKYCGTLPDGGYYGTAFIMQAIKSGNTVKAVVTDKTADTVKILTGIYRKGGMAASSISETEQKYFETVKSILTENDIPTDFITYHKGNYFTIRMETLRYSFVILKIRTLKKYTYMLFTGKDDMDYIRYNNIRFIKGTSSENGLRIILDSPEDIKKMTPIILNKIKNFISD